MSYLTYFVKYNARYVYKYLTITVKVDYFCHRRFGLIDTGITFHRFRGKDEQQQAVCYSSFWWPANGTLPLSRNWLGAISLFEFAFLCLYCAFLAQSHGQCRHPGKTAQFHRFDGSAGDNNDR